MNFFFSNDWHCLPAKPIYTIFFIFFSTVFAHSQVDTILINTTVGTLHSHCIDLGSLAGDFESLSNFCPMESGTACSVNIDSDVPNCIDFLGLTEGLETACMVLCDNAQNCDSIYFLIEVLTDLQIPCDPIFSSATQDIILEDCADLAPFCIPLGLDEIAFYECYQNGTLVTENFFACDQDSIIAYTYLTLFGQGELGPYSLDSWHINGVPYSGIFENIESLIALMNFIDPEGNWYLDPLVPFTITGGNDANWYSELILSQPQIDNSTAVLGINFGLDPQGASINLAAGNHELILVHQGTGCADTMNVNVACFSTDFIYESVYSGSNGTICIPTDELPGNTFTSVSNICPNDAGDHIIFEVFEDDNCIEYEAIGGGTETACIVICNEDYVGHTTILVFDVVKPIDGLIEQEIYLGETSALCLDTTELVGTINHYENFCPAGDNVYFNLSAQDYCMSLTGLKIGSDTACVALCDDLGGCDTTLLIVKVIMPLDISIPEAVEDQVETTQGHPVVINATGNDNLQDYDSYFIELQPENGNVQILMDGTFQYTPNPEFCGIDIFTYQICNPLNECSFATVVIQVHCADVQIFDGFSPNGDAFNDHFYIEGIEAFPNSELNIFNRYGSLVYHKKAYQNNWDGSWDGLKLPDGIYAYYLELNNSAKDSFKGFLYLKR